MREHDLFSPQRAQQGEAKVHDGTICTNEPLEMWGTDGTLAQTNGFIARFWKTLKKQVLEGRIYQTLAYLRKALRDLVDYYNHRWRLEKLGGHTPDEIRQARLSRQAA